MSCETPHKWGLRQTLLELNFDKGTLVLAGKGDRLDFVAGRLGFVFDARVGMYRAPAYRYRGVKEAAVSNNFELQDSVMVGANVLPWPWKPDRRGSVSESLRDYQRAALELWLANGKKGLVSLPTGSGKTRLAAAAIEVCATAVLCLVPTIVLMHQWERELKELFPSVNIGLLGESSFSLAAVTVATYASALLHATKIGKLFDLLVLDEAHHFGENRFDEILIMSTARFRLALTATPPEKPAQLKRLQALVGQWISRKSVIELLGSYLSPYEHLVFPVSLSAGQQRCHTELQKKYLDSVRFLKAQGCTPTRSELLKTEKGRRALKARAAASKITNNCMCKVKKIAELLEQFRGKRAIIFMGSVEAAVQVSEKYWLPLITGETAKLERDSLIADFRLGRLSVIVTCQVLNEGFDLPETDLVIIAGGSQGKRELKQRIGRSLRKVTGKTALVIELVSSGTLEEKLALRPLAGFLRPKRCTEIRGVSCASSSEV